VTESLRLSASFMRRHQETSRQEEGSARRRREHVSKVSMSEARVSSRRWRTRLGSGEQRRERFIWVGGYFSNYQINLSRKHKRNPKTAGGLKNKQTEQPTKDTGRATAPQAFLDLHLSHRHGPPLEELRHDRNRTRTKI